MHIYFKTILNMNAHLFIVIYLYYLFGLCLYIHVMLFEPPAVYYQLRMLKPKMCTESTL